MESNISQNIFITINNNYYEIIVNGNIITEKVCIISRIIIWNGKVIA